MGDSLRFVLSPESLSGTFRVFGSSHLCILVLTLALSMLVVRVSRGSPIWRERIRLGLAWIFVLNEVLWQVWMIAFQQWDARYSLPLHLCSATALLCAFALLTLRREAYEVAYFWGFAGTTQAILTPELVYDFPHVRFFFFFIGHSGIIIALVYLTFVAGMRPTWRSLWHASLITLAYVLFMGLVDSLIGANYLYLAAKPATSTLLDLFGPWPWYIAPLIGIGFLAFVLCYLPFASADRRRAAAALE